MEDSEKHCRVFISVYKNLYKNYSELFLMCWGTGELVCSVVHSASTCSDMQSTAAELPGLKCSSLSGRKCFGITFQNASRGVELWNGERYWILLLAFSINKAVCLSPLCWGFSLSPNQLFSHQIKKYKNWHLIIYIEGNHISVPEEGSGCSLGKVCELNMWTERKKKGNRRVA